MKTAIVTGAAGGIGVAIATLFASTGATVIALYRSFTGVSEQVAGAGHILNIDGGWLAVRVAP